MKFFKKVLLVFIGLVSITAITLFALTRIINPDLIHDYVNNQITQLTAQPSKIQGDIHWQIFPMPGIRVTEVQIGTANANAPYSATVHNLLFNLNFKPLLQGKLVFSEIKVNGFEMNINTEATSSKQLIQNNATSKSSIQEKFAVDHLLLSHGTINFIHKDQKIAIEQLQLGTEGLNFDRNEFPLQLKARISYFDKVKKSFYSQTNFKGIAVLSPQFMKNPIAHLNELKINGQLILQNISLHNLSLQKLSGKLVLNKGSVMINPLSIGLYQGEAVGDLKYSIANNYLKLNQTGTGLQSSKLMKDLFHQPSIKGPLDFSFHAEASLAAAPLKDHLLGYGMLSIHDGYLDIINLDKVIEYTSAKLDQSAKGEKTNFSELFNKEQLENAEVFKGSTPFKLVTLQYELNNAKITTRSMLFQTSQVQFKGEGEINLADNKIQSHLLALVTTDNKQLAKVQSLMGGFFPLIVEGTLTNPIIYPDLKNLKTGLSPRWVGEMLAKPVKQIKNQLKTYLDKKLKNPQI